MSAGDHVRVVGMNEATSDDWDMIPLPAKQQLGYKDDLVDVDARSGNGIADYTDGSARDQVHAEPPPASRGVQQVTYHMEATPPPSEPAGAPGSDSYNRNVLATPATGEFERTSTTTQDGVGASAARQGDDPATTQHEIPGPNERIAAQAGLDDSASVHHDTGAAARLESATPGDVPHSSTAQSSFNEQTDGASTNDATAGSEDGSGKSEVPSGSVADVMAWVGDDSARARAALEVEQERSSPRQTLLAQLNDRV